MTVATAARPPTRLADYRAPAWWVSEVELEFDLDPAETLVHARLSLHPDPAQAGTDLRLDGCDLFLLSIGLDGVPLPSSRYQVDAAGLTVFGLNGACVLQTSVRICPQANTRLEGVYASGPMLLTQCEAQGFRRITYFIDRPDVLARYRVELRGNAKRYPVLLSNGNPAAAGELPDGRHFARWIDPHPKPSYLFALVAGDIDCVEAPFTTSEGRAVAVRVWTERSDVERCRHALECALRALRWDEQRFGRAYDLDVFNIVAVQYFTMGAMENKGLNIFNARYVLADHESATDADFEAIESVIGHEHFHNWSGNRVTLRDWFQLSLKEGFTVFRDQEFSSDLHSRSLKRIDDVRLLKSRQFQEDSGPLAHAVRPAEYAEINNFYTATVYEKGAEIVRMLHTLLGEADFRRGADLYFLRHDGQAATVEDFLAAMSEVSGRDLRQFARWYAQAGTPVLTIRECWDAPTQTFHVAISQHTPTAAGHAEKAPLHIPVRYALYAADGSRIERVLEGDAQTSATLIELTQPTHALRLHAVSERPLAVYLQGLSAPVRLHLSRDAATLARIVAVEPDPLTRWEAIQCLATDALLQRGPDPAGARSALITALGDLLNHPTEDPAFVAECQRLPEVWTLADQTEVIDLDELLRQREDLLDELAECHADGFESAYRRLRAAHPGQRFDASAFAARRLIGVCLDRLTRLDPSARIASAHFAGSLCMTDRLNALACLIHVDAPTATAALAQFREHWRHDPLVTDKWLSIVASRPQPETLDDIRALIGSTELWQPANPNRVRAILGSFARNNAIACHRIDGAGYALVFEQIGCLDVLNPQVSARLLTAFEPWRKLDGNRRALIESGLRGLLANQPSADLRDVLTRLLG
ncbi:MAG: aminopeptidase N [Pseudomarimonas sp.]